MKESKSHKESKSGSENEVLVNKVKKEKENSNTYVSADSNLQTLIQSVGIGIIVLDSNLNLTLFSPLATQIFSITSKDLGNPLSDVKSKLVNIDLVSEVKSVLEKGEASESVVRTIDGAAFVMNVTPAFASDNKPNGVTVTFTNITRRIQEEEKLAYNCANMSEALEATRVGWGHWDWITGNGDWNETAKQIMDFSPGDDPGTAQGWLKRIHPDDRATIQSRIRETIAQKCDFKADYRIITRDGNLRHINATGKVMYNKEGIALSSTGVITDTTELREREEALRRSEEKYHGLFNSIDEGYCVIEVVFDGSGKPVDYIYLEVNEAFERQTGIVNAVGKSILSFAPEHEQYWFDFYGKVALTGEPLRFQNSAKELHRFYDVYAFRVGEREEKKVAILFNDISEQKRAENNLGFLSEISHDLIYIEDVDEMLHTVGTKISSYLNLSYCAFVRVDKKGNMAEVLYDWHTADTEDFVGNYDVADFTTMELQRLASKGESVVINDVASDPRVNKNIYQKLQIGSFISVPLVINGEWEFFISVCHSSPYQWRNDEISFVKELSSRIWTTLKRKRIEGELRKSEEKYRTIFSSIDEAFFLAEIIYDSNGVGVDYRILEINPAFEKLAGITTADIGKTALQIQPDIEEWWVVKYAEVLRTGEAIRFQHNVKRNQQWLDVYIAPIGTKKSGNFVVVFRDITANKQAEMELLQSEERLRLTLDAGKAGTCDLNYETGEALCNDMRYQMYGMSSHINPVNMSELVACIHPDDIADVMNEFETGIKHTGKHHEEYRVVHPDGTIRWISESGEVVEWKNGRPQRIISIMFDITERKTEEKQKDDFFNIASHELKTPVTSIKAFTQILEYMFRQANDSHSADLMSRLNKQVDRLTNLIKDMLDITKMTEGQLPLSFETFDIADLVKEITQEMQHTSSHHQIMLSCSPLSLIKGDKERLGQVLTNLLSNAIKYSPVKHLPESTMILVNMKEEEGEIRITVQDFGIGMSNGTVSRLFQRFFRSDDPDTHTYPGLGLGLYISKQIMKRHGGSIAVQSEKGKGSTFTMILPVAQNGEEA